MLSVSERVANKRVYSPTAGFTALRHLRPAHRPTTNWWESLNDGNTLAAGLTLVGLERRSGVPQSLINGYECDRSEPKWRTLSGRQRDIEK